MRKGMIVDDAAIMRNRLRLILENDFIIIAEAANGIDAFELYSKHKPDFLTLDISMPEMNGLDTLKKILTSFPDANIIIVSAVGQKQNVFEALSIGAKDFIVKPFDSDRVLKSVKRLFE
jgi:two-component system, chemotaxis family, chemotaxis protein CheY